MKTFIKYDFYFQVILYILCILCSTLDGNFKSNFAISLFFIGCSQTISYVIRIIGLEPKNLIFNIYTVSYLIFLFFAFLTIITQFNTLVYFIAVLINLMAILFLISSFIDYNNRESTNF